MDLTTVFRLALGIVVLLLIALYLSLQKTRREFRQLLGIVAGMRMRVFEQEIRQLKMPGMFIHEDTAQQVASVFLSLISDELRTKVEQEYEQSCPSYIPLWKYFLYQYRFEPQIAKRFEPSQPITSIPELSMYEISAIGDELKQILSGIQNMMKSLKGDSTSNRDAQSKHPSTC